MQKYELVLLLDVNKSDKERQSFIEGFEKDIKDMMIEKDEIGIQETVYELQQKRGNNRAFFICYYLNLDVNHIADLKKKMMYNPIIIRSTFFKLSSQHKIRPFLALQTELEKLIEGWENKKFGQKIGFFADEKNSDYNDWKSIVMLKKYLTRFGEIKPRKYTHNSVLQQKKLRKSITRARELGLLYYTR